MNAVWGQRIGLLMYDVCLPLPRSQALCVHRLQYEIRTVNEPRPSVWISYCKRRTHRAWERGYALPYTVCWTVIFLHFLKTHAGSAKAAIGKSGLTNAKLHNLQICIGLIPMPLPDFISQPGSEARYAYQKMESSFYHLQMLWQSTWQLSGGHRTFVSTALLPGPLRVLREWEN